MEILFVLMVSVVVATLGDISSESKNNNPVEKVKVIQTEEANPSLAKAKLKEPIKKPELVIKEVKPELVEAEEVKPELVEAKEVKPELAEAEKVNELNVKEEGQRWSNIILYVLGAIVVVATGIYFFTRRKTITSISATDTTSRKFNEEKTPTQEQEPTQEQKETQSIETTEEKPSEDDNK